MQINQMPRELLVERLESLVPELLEKERLLNELTEEREAEHRLLAMVSHDLRSPLNVISLNLTLLDRSLPAADDRRRGAEQLRVIKQAVRSLSRLVEDLLTASTIEAGRFSATCVPEPVSGLIEDLTDNFRLDASDHTVQLVTWLPLGLPRVSCDRGRVLQLFGNLVGNALKVTPAGGTVRITAAQEDVFVRFSVADTGPGIAPEQLPRLFDRYWRGAHSGSSGTGLGLYIARGIAETQGGRVGVASTPGEGATFWFTLPVAL